MIKTTTRDVSKSEAELSTECDYSPMKRLGVS